MNGKNYSYPLDPDWSLPEIEQVIAMFRIVEDVYEVGANRDQVLQRYHQFKKVINSKASEKRLGREFEHLSGYSLYQVVKLAQDSNSKRIKLVGD